jgi:hypothetical protein
MLFLGKEASYETGLALKMLKNLSSIDEILALLVADVGGDAPSTQTLRRLQRALSLDSAEQLGALYSGLHWLLRACARSGLKPKVLADELREVSMHAPFIAPFVGAVEQARGAASTPEALAGSSAPSFADLQWRLDVAISSSAVGKVLRPHLTMQCSLDDGSETTFAVSKESFNELRFTVAKLLKECQDLEARLPPMAAPAM